MAIQFRAAFLLTALVGLGACSTSPPTPQAEAGIEGLQVFANLGRSNGQWVVSGYCTTAAKSARSSLLPCNVSAMQKDEALFFDLATLRPYKDDNKLGCIDYSLVDEYPERIKRCQEFESIYNASLSPISALGTAIRFATTFGTTLGRVWVLDEDRFRAAIESAMPAPQRQAYLVAERDTRMGVIKARQDYAAAAPAREAAAQAASQEAARQRALKRQQFQTERQRLAREAQNRFTTLSAQPKTIGMTVCSRDNRLGYVEQLAGSRIKLAIKGRAVVRRERVYRDDDARGPFDVDTTGLPIDWVSNPGLSNLEVAVLDPHYLFQPQQTIKLGAIGTGEIWDDATYWAACDWRF
jgi:hypothetical protein